MTLLSHTRISQVRAYCRAVPYWSEDDQAQRCREWAAERGLRVEVYRESVHGRHEFLRALRNSDLVLLPRVDVLAIALKTRGAPRPSADLSGVLARITGTAASTVELLSGATFGEPEWAAAVVSGMSRAVSGRSQPRERMRELGRRGGARAREKSIVAEWTADTPEARERLERWRDVWCSARHPNARTAQAHLPKALRSVCRRTLERIFGGRRAPPAKRNGK